MDPKPITYWDYIAVEPLLSLQKGIAEDESSLDNDEVMFITIHQIDELWLKLVLRELVSVRNLFAQARVPEQALASAVRGIRRMSLIFKKLADHFELMETMTTRDYLAFRDKLSGASGFQSAQLREIEILLGLSDARRIPFGHDKDYRSALRNHDGSPSPALRRVERRKEDRPTLHEALNEWLWRTPIFGSTPDDPDDEAVVRRFASQFLDAHAAITRATMDRAVANAPSPEDGTRIKGQFERELSRTRAFLLAEEGAKDGEATGDRRTARIRAALVFIESYRELPLLAWPREVLDSLVAFEQAFVVFRQRHARMVERVIGRRTGTGGSSGVAYLDRTALEYRIFDDMWAVRTLLIAERHLPTLERPDVYGVAPGD